MYDESDTKTVEISTVNNRDNTPWMHWLKFILPSAIGAFLFITPISIDDKITVPLAFLTNEFLRVFADYLAAMLLGVMLISSALTLGVTFYTRRNQRPNNVFLSLFDARWPWIVFRILGLVCVILVYTQIGPEWIWGEKTGHPVVYDLGFLLLGIYILAPLLLPLLTDYGFIEFIGVIFSKPFKFIFGLPGRAAIDGLASWLGAAGIGVLLTIKQYENGFYTKREAAVIATNFSVVSLPFTIILLELVGLGHLFIPFYTTQMLTGLLLAIILPKIPPLSRVPDTFYEQSKFSARGDVLRGRPILTAAKEEALTRARLAPGFKGFAFNSSYGIIDVLFAILPVAISVSILALALINYTPIATFLSYPFIPILQALQIPEAVTAAPAMLTGFAETFLPALVAKEIDVELTKFVVTCVALTQIIYMSEVGIIILRSPIPLSFVNLLQIYLMRTLLALPIVTFVAHFVVF